MLITIHWKKKWNVNFFSILFQTRKWPWSIQQKEEENKNLRDHISLALMVKLKRGCVFGKNLYAIDIFFFCFHELSCLLKHGINLKLNGLTCLPSSFVGFLSGSKWMPNVSFAFQSISSFVFAPMYWAWSIQQKEEENDKKWSSC